MKRIIITALLAIFCISNMQAGKNRGKVITPRPTPNVAIGGGTSMPSNNAKDKAFLSNSTAISIDASIPITKRGWGPNGNWFGVNIGGSYNFGGKGGFGTSPNPYAITGQTSSMVADRGKDPADPGFRMGAGPQANFHFGKLMVSPMLLGEYFAMTRKEMSSVQTTQYNGQSYDFTLATLPETKTRGFAVTPKLRLQYMFSNRFGLFADASYTTGPKVETQITKLIPNGAVNQQGTYEIQSLQNASYVKGETKTTSYNATGINFGVVIGLGRNGSKGWNGVAETAQSIPTVNTNTMPNRRVAGDIKKGWDGTVKGLFVGNNTDIMVSKNGGIEKLIEQINKGGKEKASIYKYEDREFLQLLSKEETNYYEIDNNSNSTFRFINVGGVTCKVATCPNGSICKLTFFGGRERCACDNGTSTSGNGCSDVTIAHQINDFIPQLDASAIAIPISTDNTGHLTATSIKDLKDLMLQAFPKATVTKSEIIKEEKDKFIKVDLNENGNVFSVVNMVNNPNHTWILLACTGNCNGSITDCTSKNPNLLGACNCPGDNHCFGVNGIVFGLSTNISIEK